MAPGALTKAYQRTGKAWTRPEIYDIMEHAADMAQKHDTRFGIGEDDGGRIMVCPEESLPRDVCRICRTAALQSTGRQDIRWEFETYSRDGLSYTDVRLQIDDAVSRVLDHLAYGIVESGPLLDMTLGLAQLNAVLDGTRLIQKRRGGRLICGIKRSGANKNRGRTVAISQMSQRPEFIEPLAAVVSDDGVSMLNRPQNMARLKPDSSSGDSNKTWNSTRERIAYRIYNGGWAFATRLYGVFEAGKDGIKVLQDEITDMAIICRAHVGYRGCTILISVNQYGHLGCTYRPESGATDTSITIDSKSLWDGDEISKDAVARSAQDVVRRFSRLRPFITDVPSASPERRRDVMQRFSGSRLFRTNTVELAGFPSFPGPEENYPLPPTPYPGEPAMIPIVRHGFSIIK